MLFDPVLEMREKNRNDNDYYKGPKLLCFHCYNEIKGKVYFYDDKPYDEYCYQFRYVINPVEEELEERKKLLEKALDRDRQKIDS